MAAKERSGIIGIDLGTTNSCLAALGERRPQVIESAEGDRTTPSVVCFLEEGERLVGAPARRVAAVNPERTVLSVKRLMGKTLAEVGEAAGRLPYRLAPGPNDAVRIGIDDQLYAPEQVSAMILEKLKSDGEARLGAPIEQAVITVPAYFNEAQRQATKQAAEIAGLEVLRLINEPTAAALAYGFEVGREERLLVFDLGGGTFDVSVLEIGDDVFQVLATAGDNHLGGDDFDRVIVDHIIERFESEHGIDLRAGEGGEDGRQAAVMQRLFEAAERVKIELSSMPRALISEPFIAVGKNGPEHLEMTLTRGELNTMVAELLDRLVAPTQKALQAAGVEPEEIDHVLLVGGMTRMPAVQERVREMIGREPRKEVNPDEAVALGAAIQAGILAGEVADVLLVDVTPLSLGIETSGGLVSRLIPANTMVPAQATEIFTTARDNQPSVAVKILQGERELADDNRLLGQLKLLDIPPAQAGVPQIEVSFQLDADGILHVAARDLGTGNEKRTRVEATTGLSDEEVERMRAEAQARRAADLERRREIEAKNRAQDALLRVERALARADLDAAERARIEGIAAEVRHLLEADGAETERIDEALERLLGAHILSEDLFAGEDPELELRFTEALGEARSEPQEFEIKLGEGE